LLIAVVFFYLTGAFDFISISAFPEAQCVQARTSQPIILPFSTVLVNKERFS
jgi:hypothetical protein